MFLMRLLIVSARVVASWATFNLWDYAGVMKKLFGPFVFLFILLFLTGCQTAQLVIQEPMARPAVPLRLIATVSKEREPFFSDKLTNELSEAGYGILSHGRTISLLRKLDLEGDDIVDQQVLSILKDRRIDAVMTVTIEVVNAGLINLLDKVRVRVLSTTDGAIFASLFWTNGNAGEPGSPADSSVRMSATAAAHQIAEALIRQLGPPGPKETVFMDDLIAAAGSARNEFLNRTPSAVAPIPHNVSAPAYVTSEPRITSTVGAWGEKRYKRVAILPFKTRRGDDQSIADALTPEFMKAGFTVIERNQLTSVFQELRLSYTGIISSESIKQVGKLAQVDALVIGSMDVVPYRSSDAISYGNDGVAGFLARFVSLRMVDIETGKVVLSSTFKNGDTRATYVPTSNIPSMMMQDVRLRMGQSDSESKPNDVTSPQVSASTNSSENKDDPKHSCPEGESWRFEQCYPIKPIFGGSK